MSTRNRLEGALDGALHLLDRQLVDVHGRLLGKADDIELGERDGELVVLAVLTGPAALVARLGRGDGTAALRSWQALRPTEPGRTWPWRIDLADVAHVDSAIHLRLPREGVVRRERPAEHRLSDLTGMDVATPDGRYGRVLDARFRPRPGDGRLALRSLVVGKGRPGALFGYDRRGDQGPALVRGVVRRLHRHSGIIDAHDARIDWVAGVVHVAAAPEDAPGHPFD